VTLLKRFIRPTANRRVINPASGKPLASGGELVDYDQYWVRREIDGDVSIQEVESTERASGSKGKAAMSTKEQTP
jgi:hypothetical protein